MIGKSFDQASRLVKLRNPQAEITEALTPKPEAERAVDGALSSSAEAVRGWQALDASGRWCRVAMQWIGAPRLATGFASVSD